MFFCINFINLKNTGRNPARDKSSFFFIGVDLYLHQFLRKKTYFVLTAADQFQVQLDQTKISGPIPP